MAVSLVRIAQRKPDTWIKTDTPWTYSESMIWLLASELSIDVQYDCFFGGVGHFYTVFGTKINIFIIGIFNKGACTSWSSFLFLLIERTVEVCNWLRWDKGRDLEKKV